MTIFSVLTPFNARLTFTQELKHQFNTSGPLLFSSQNTSVQHTCQFNTQGELNWEVYWADEFSVLNWRFFMLNRGVCWIAGFVELTVVLIWRVFGLELTDFGLRKGVVYVLKQLKYRPYFCVSYIIYNIIIIYY